jgi:hypothetical protein
LQALEPKLAEFHHIRSEEDFRRLTAEDPAKAAELESLLTRIASATVRSVPPSLVERGRVSFWERYAGDTA